MKNKKCGELEECSAQCKKLQYGECKYLSLDEIKILLDQTDWNDLDKGEVMFEYLLKGE